MSNFGGGPDCDSRAHGDDLRAFDRLAPELRDRLRRSRDNLCAHCIAAMAKRDLAATLDWLDHERLFRVVLTRRGQFLVAEEELRP